MAGVFAKALTSHDVPHLDESIARSRHQLVALQLNSVDRATMGKNGSQETAVIDIPDANGLVFGATDNKAIVKAHVEHTGRMAAKTHDGLKRLHVPHNQRRIRGARHHDVFVVAQTEHTAFMTVQCLYTLVGAEVPEFDGSVTAAGNDLLLVELQAIDTVNMANQVVSGYTTVLPAIVQDMALFVQMIPI